MTRRARSIWERLAMESVEGPTVTISIPRELAQELVGALMGSLEMDGGAGAHEEPDEDDFGGAPDGDADDSDPLAALMGGAGDDDIEPGGLDVDEPDDDDSEDDDDDDDKEEATMPMRRGGAPRPGTALGERRNRRR